MLSLTRRLKERIHIGDDIQIVILGIQGNQVRLGIEAPKNIGVHRAEIYKKIQGESKIQETEINGNL